jgi:hypothetical protein
MKEREPVVAGQFYPANPKDLRAFIASFVHKPQKMLDAKAVVVPHAGYVYSGSVAGEVFSSVLLPKRMILLGPNHSGWGAALALAPEGLWRTPLGTVPIDGEMNRGLLAQCPLLQEDFLGHRNEHSLEVQLPFLQTLEPDFRFSAICVRTDDYASLESLGHGMARAVESLREPVLLISSSDMTHYETAESAARQDRFAIDRMLQVDPEGLYRTVLERNISMCGFAPTVAVLVACRDMGAAGGHLVRYTNSGEASGDYRRVVGYAGIAIA